MNYYASPAGLPTNAGSRISPWDIRTALTEPTISAGDTIILLGGTYNAQVKPDLNGADGNKITVRSDGVFGTSDWAVIDGYVHGVLNGAIDDDDTTLSVTQADNYIFIPNDVLRIGTSGGVFEDVYISSGTNPYTVVRGWGGTTPISHLDGAFLYLNGGQAATLQPQSTASHIRFRDFEIKDSNPVREYFVGGAGYFRGGEGIQNFADDCEFIHLHIHDTLDGLFESESAERTVAYGNILYNIGHVGGDRPHGHGLYIQNLGGGAGAKTFKENISFNNFGLGSKAYGAGPGHSNDILFEGEIRFNNGSPGDYTGSPVDGVPEFPAGHRYGNLEVGGDEQPSDNITVNECLLYHGAGLIVELPGLYLGRIAGNTDLTVTDNYVVQPHDTCLMDKWDGVAMSGNTFIQTDAVAGKMVFMRDTVNAAINLNTYVDNSAEVECSGPMDRNSFLKTGVTGTCGAYLRYSEWQAEGFDAGSSYIEGAIPASNDIFVRLVDDYEAKRHNIVIYNWEGSSSVSVALSGMSAGDPYIIRNVQNWFGQPLTGIYNGSSVSIPMTDTTVTTPIGHPFTPASTMPDFGVFVAQLKVAPSVALSGSVTVQGVTLNG